MESKLCFMQDRNIADIRCTDQPLAATLFFEHAHCSHAETVRPTHMHSVHALTYTCLVLPNLVGVRLIHNREFGAIEAMAEPAFTQS